MGRDPRPWDRRRIAAAAPLGVVLVVVLGAGLLVDDRVRARESHQVSACVAAARGAVTFTSARVDAILGYVRPTLHHGRNPALRRRLMRTISEAVAPTVPEVRRARGRCERTRVLAVHLELRARRGDCLRLLDADLAYLRSVVADGSNALGARPLEPGTCVPPEKET